MNYIVKRQKKKDRGYNFKIMNRDVDDPLFHDPNVPNKVLIHAPTRSEMRAFKQDKAREVPEYLRTINESYDVSGFEESKDQVDYMLAEFKQKFDDQEAEGEEDGEDEYEFDEIEVDAEGDEEYEFMGFNNKVDIEFAKEVKNIYKYKPAEGVKYIQYDAFGLPKTEEMRKMKAELNLNEKDILEDYGTQVLFIKPPEDYKLSGYHRNVDIDRKEMNVEMREVYDMMEEVDQEVPEDDCIDDDFLAMLNDNQPALVEKLSEDDDNAGEFDEFGELADGENEALLKARQEADEFMKNIPMGLSDDMQMKLAGAREFLANKNKPQEAEGIPEELDEEFQDVMEEYNDDDIGAGMDDYEQFEDMIDQDAFDEIMQEFIETKGEQCKKLYSKYHDEEFSSKITVEGNGIEEFKETDGLMNEKVYKILKQKNGEFVKLVPKEEMHRIQEKLNEEEIEKTRQSIKAKILKFTEDLLRKEAEGDDEDSEEIEEDQDEKKWDVETVLTTRTNTDNHPGIIKGTVRIRRNIIKLDPRTKAPELDIEHVKVEKKEKPQPFVVEVLSEEESEEEPDLDTEELKNVEDMTDKEKEKYYKKLHKKQVKEEKRERRKMKKQMKKEFNRQHLKFNKVNAVGQGQIKPGVSVRRI